jgi:hypothetical protein
MSTIPVLSLLGKNSMVIVARLGEWTGTPYSFWELDTSLSPVLFLLLVLGAWNVLKKKPPIRFSWKKLFAAGFLLFSVVLVIQFSIAKGFLFETLRTLPVMMSLHANTRFTASFVLPLAILGAKVFDVWIIRQTGRIRSLLCFLLFDGFILIAFWTYFLLPLEVQLRTCYMDSFIQTYALIQAGDTMPVDKIIPDMNDYEVFLAGASNTTRHYDPLFRDNNEAFHPEVHEGSVFELDNGYYNMTNPTGFLFPKENGTRFYERFRASEYGTLSEFLNRRQPDWAISFLQKVLDFAALLTFIGVCLGLTFYGIRSGQNRFRMLGIAGRKFIS